MESVSKRFKTKISLQVYVTDKLDYFWKVQHVSFKHYFDYPPAFLICVYLKTFSVVILKELFLNE